MTDEDAGVAAVVGTADPRTYDEICKSVAIDIPRTAIGSAKPVEITVPIKRVQRHMGAGLVALQGENGHAYQS